MSSIKRSSGSSGKAGVTSDNGRDSDSERDLTLTGDDARAAAPFDESICGEEDPGVGLEFLVKRDEMGGVPNAGHPKGGERGDHRKKTR